MQITDFSVFQALLSEVHQKAFGEPISRLSLSKAQMLSWLIMESTGELMSYKSLSNYMAAAIEGCPGKVNPSLTSLVILAAFVTGEQRDKKPILVQWARFRNQIFTAA